MGGLSESLITLKSLIMSERNPDTEGFGCFLVLAIVAIVAIGWALGYSTATSKVESKTIITPTIKLNIVDNKVDTTYVYIKPK
jgi:hypothetical protein